MMMLKMSKNSVYRSVLASLALAATMIVNAVFAQDQTAINTIQSSDKLTVTLKAKLARLQRTISFCRSQSFDHI